MEFEIIKNENIEINLIENGIKVAKATCYFKNTPEIEGEKVGAIGEFETDSEPNFIGKYYQVKYGFGEFYYTDMK